MVCLQEDLRQAGDRVNDPGNPGKTYLCGKGITRFAPMSAAAAGLMGTVRSVDSDRIAAMIDKLSRIFEASGIRTGVTEGSIRQPSSAVTASPPTRCTCKSVTWPKDFKRRYLRPWGLKPSPRPWSVCSGPTRARAWTR